MNIRVIVTNSAGETLHDRVGTISARHPSTVRAAHTRLTNRLMRVYAGQWQRIEIQHTQVIA